MSCLFLQNHVIIQYEVNMYFNLWYKFHEYDQFNKFLLLDSRSLYVFLDQKIVKYL